MRRLVMREGIGGVTRNPFTQKGILIALDSNIFRVHTVVSN
jgi:hypothetical protein